MAQLLKRGRVWYVRVQHGGRDHWRSTGCTGRRDAAAKAAGILADIRGEVAAAGVFDKLQLAIEALDPTARDDARRDFARRLLRGTSTKLPVAAAWDFWLASPGKGRRSTPKPVTIEGYRALWGRFAAWLAEHHGEVEYLHEVTDRIAEAYARDLHAGGFAPRTYNGHVLFLRGMFRTLSTEAGIERNPWEQVGTVEKETETKRPLTAGELATICRRATGDMRYWIALGIFTGLRLVDVITLRWAEVDLAGGVIRRVPAKVSRRNRAIPVPITPALSVMLQQLRAAAAPDDEYLFPEAVIRYRRDRGSITGQIQSFFNDCGIATTEAAKADSPRRRVIVRAGFHSLRHSFVSLLAASGTPLSVVQELVGHGSPSMTQHYMHADPEQKRLAVASLPEKLFR